MLSGVYFLNNMKIWDKLKFIVSFVILSVFPFFAKGEELLDNPLETNSFTELASAISELAIEIGIPIAAIFIIYSGLKFVTARGNKDKIVEAKVGLMWALAGTAILLGAWAITTVLKDTIELIK